VFIRVYRLEIQSVMLVFSTQLCELWPLLPSLWFNYVNTYKIYTYTVHYTVRQGGGYGVIGGEGAPDR
jgi:hypothetical protein